MNKMLKDYAYGIGFVLLLIGLLLRHGFPDAGRVWELLPYFLSGAGTGLVGFGIVIIFRKRLRENNPAKAREYDINEKDERNISINEKASYVTAQVTFVALVILFIVFIVMNNIAAALMTAAVALIHKVSFLIGVHVLEKKL